MRVLFAYKFCGLGGVETSILNKIEALRLYDIGAHAVFGSYYGDGGCSLATRCDITVGPTKHQLREMLATGFDAIAVVDYPEFIDMLDDLRSTAPVVMETHASFPPALATLHRNVNHCRIAAIVVPTQFNKRLIEAALHRERKIAVIPNPIDTKRFSASAANVSQSAVSPSGPVILWVGRLEDEKNPQDFIKLVNQLAPSHPEVRFLIVGDAFSNAEYVAYKSRLMAETNCDLRERVVFRQFVPHDEMPRVYSFAARSGGCLVSTSRFESAPMIILEAMCCHCPVVSTAVGGVGELISDGVNGRLYAVNDVDAASKAIRDVIDPKNVEARAALVRRAAMDVEQNHSLAHVGQAYQTLLEQLPRPSRLAKQHVTNGRPEHIVPGLVSTIIPVLNRAELLKEAVASVLSQTYDKVEVIIVDDGSTDDTQDLCDQLAQEHAQVTAIHIPHCGRAGLAREAGRRIARGEFIQYLDSDDLLLPTKFARMVALLNENSGCDIAYCGTRRYRIGAAPSSTPAALTGTTHHTMLPAALTQRFWWTSTPLYRRRLCDEAGPWSELLFWEDIEYDIRLATHNPKLCHCAECLTDVRDHELGRLSGSRFLDTPRLLSHAVQGAQLIYDSVKRAGLTYADEHVRSFVDDVRLLYNKCLEFGLKEAATACQTILMHSLETDDCSSVGQYDVRATIEPQTTVLKARPGQSVVCEVRIVNDSTVSFHGGEFATEIGCRVLDIDGLPRRFDNPTTVVSQPIRPGESQVIDLWVQAPLERGLYYVEIDILWASCAWLSSLGTPKGYLKLVVSEACEHAPWRLNVHGDNRAEIRFPEGGDETVRIDIHHALTDTPWHIQLNRDRLSVMAKHRYKVTFRARADEPRDVAIAISRAHAPWDNLGLYREVHLTREWQLFAEEFRVTDHEGHARVHFDIGGNNASIEVAEVALRTVPGDELVVAPPFSATARLQMDIGVKPLSDVWGTDRGLPIHRYYLEQYLAEYASDIRGTCLEFQDPQYTPRFGGSAVDCLEILHVDDSNPLATLVADLTKTNQLPSNHFDCIICTHVLHVISDVERTVSELFRILAPGGVLLVAVPHISMYGADYGELWRFTPKGLEHVLRKSFGPEDVAIQAYGNSLTAAGEIRGMVSEEFLKSELNAHDPRFPVEVCARARKRT